MLDMLLWHVLDEINDEKLAVQFYFIRALS